MAKPVPGRAPFDAFGALCVPALVCCGGGGGGEGREKKVKRRERRVSVRWRMFPFLFLFEFLLPLSFFRSYYDYIVYYYLIYIIV